MAVILPNFNFIVTNICIYAYLKTYFQELSIFPNLTLSLRANFIIEVILTQLVKGNKGIDQPILECINFHYNSYTTE